MFSQRPSNTSRTGLPSSRMYPALTSVSMPRSSKHVSTAPIEVGAVRVVVRFDHGASRCPLRVRVRASGRRGDPTGRARCGVG